MKNEITDKDIERLFEKVLQQPPLVNDIKVHSLLYNAPKPAISGNSINHFIHSHLNTIIMSTIISSILIGTFLWFNPGHKKSVTTIANQKTINNSVISKPVSNQVHTKTIKTVANKVRTSEPAILAGSTPVVKASEILSNNSDIPVENVKSKPSMDKGPVSGEDYMMELTTEELKKLGVLVTDSGLYYLNITPDGFMSEYSRPYDIWVMARRKDGGKSKPFTNRIGNSENVLSLNSFYVYYSTNDQIINSNNNRITVSANEKFKLVYPKTELHQPLYFRPGLTQSVQNIFTIIDSIPKEENRQFMDTYRPDMLKSIDDTLVPVKVHLTKPELFGVKTKILWFVSNNDFYKALPERYSNKIRNFCENQKQLKKKYQIPNSVDYNYVYEYFDYLESQVKYIDFTKEELSRIGIRFIKDSNINKAGLEYRDRISSILWCKKQNYSMSSSSKNDTGKLVLYAAYYSDFKDKILYKMHVGYGKSEPPKMNELIPIRVKKEMPGDYELRDDIIFWYAATEALFDSLPARIGDELKQDYRTIMIRRDPNVSLEEKMKLKSTCTYFEECKATLFDVNFTVSPNPVGDELNIDLQLTKPEKISITLLSISGRKIQTLLPLKSIPEGSQRLTYSTSNIGNGFFLITVQNSKGQFKTQRIVKL